MYIFLISTWQDPAFRIKKVYLYLAFTHVNYLVKASESNVF